MTAYIIRRLGLALVVMFGVSVFTFLVTVIVPSNPAMRWVGPHAKLEQIEKAKIELGLDKPVHIRYFKYIASFLRGDWGVSIRTHQPVLKDIAT